MIRRPPRSTRTEHSFPTRRSSDLIQALQRQAEQRFRAKEQELTTKLRDTEEQLRKIQGSEAAEGSAVLTNEQREAIGSFREEAVRIRRELRDVQHAVRRAVESLTNWLQAPKIGGLPDRKSVVEGKSVSVR